MSLLACDVCSTLQVRFPSVRTACLFRPEAGDATDRLVSHISMDGERQWERSQFLLPGESLAFFFKCHLMS